MDGDERRAEDLLREMDLGPNARMGRPGLAPTPGSLRCLLRAIRDATEAVRIFETHRRAGRLTQAGLETLERYRRYHEAAVRVLVEHCQHPDGHAMPAFGAERQRDVEGIHERGLEATGRFDELSEERRLRGR